MNPLLNLGIQLIQALQEMSPVSTAMKFSFLGTIEFYLLLIPCVLGGRHSLVPCCWC
jgi:hypothetical protein